MNTKSWSYPRCVAWRGGVDDARRRRRRRALAFWGGTGRGVRVILVADGVCEKSRRLSETVTPTTPSRSAAGSTQRTSMDAGALDAPASASPVVSFTGTARRPATGPMVPALHQIGPSAPGTPRCSPRIVATDPPVTGARRGSTDRTTISGRTECVGAPAPEPPRGTSRPRSDPPRRRRRKPPSRRSPLAGGVSHRATADETACIGTATSPKKMCPPSSASEPGPAPKTSPRRRLRPATTATDPPAAEATSGATESATGAAYTSTASESLE